MIFLQLCGRRLAAGAVTASRDAPPPRRRGTTETRSPREAQSQGAGPDCRGRGEMGQRGQAAACSPPALRRKRLRVHGVTPPSSLLTLCVVLLCSDHLVAIEVNGTVGDSLIIQFSFKGSVNHTLLKYANLYKNGNKTAEWWAASRSDFSYHLSFNVTPSQVVLVIRDLTEADSGSYYVAVFYNHSSAEFTESLPVLLSVHPAVTDEPFIGGTEAPPGSSHSVTVVLVVCCLGVAVILVALLSWFCLTTAGGSANQPSQGSPSNSQVTYKEPSHAASHSIEYGVLDFQSRSSGEDGGQDRGSRPGIQDSVEYSIITFQRNQQGAAFAQAGLC
ncbi:hypothetical protein GN956_G25200 [Arapaima gigas]